MTIYQEMDINNQYPNEDKFGAITLEPEYIPVSLLHRKEELRSIARNFRSLLSKTNFSTIILVLGGPGYGKTALVRFTLRRIAEIAENRQILLFSNYQNCWLNRTSSSILANVTEDILGPEVKTRGISSEEIGIILKTFLLENKAHLILVLDDVNALTTEDLNTFFILQEQYGIDSRISLILISRPTEWNILASSLNTRINEIITLYPYSSSEILSIINYRGNLAFKPQSVEPDVYDLVADIADQSHNLRMGIELLARAGEYAIEKNKVITTEIIRNIKSKIYPELRKEVLESLHQHELLALLGIARRLTNKGFIHTTIVDGYRYYKMAAEEWGQEPKGESSFRGYLNTLKTLGLINIVVTATGRKKRGVRARISMNDIPASIVIDRVGEQLVIIEEL
ncbi:MAG: Cdc6/Cdc18 family protein [Candidatus Thorarchaeota archaeon]